MKTPSASKVMLAGFSVQGRAGSTPFPLPMGGGLKEVRLPISALLTRIRKLIPRQNTGRMYQLGELHGIRLLEMQTHLASCAVCRNELKDLRRVSELLQAAPGVELREMEGADKCCGLGGTFNVYHYDTSMQINASKTAAILNSKAEAVVTGCPGCMMQLSDGLKQQGAKTRVMHTLEVLARRIR